MGVQIRLGHHLRRECGRVFRRPMCREFVNENGAQPDHGEDGNGRQPDRQSPPPQLAARDERGEDEEYRAERASQGRAPDRQVVRSPVSHRRHRHEQEVGKREHRQRGCQQQFVQVGAPAQPAEHQERGEQCDKRPSRLNRDPHRWPSVVRVQLRRQDERDRDQARGQCRADERGTGIVQQAAHTSTVLAVRPGGPAVFR